MHDFGVTCSYSEVLQFKASAATAAAQDVHSNLRAITDAKHGLIQAVADNFDANISSQNDLQSIHALAPSDWRPGGRGFIPRRGRQHSFVEIDHEIFSTVILSLTLIQEGQLSVSGKRMCTILVNRLED